MTTIGITSGMKGFYAVLYDNNFMPILTGDGHKCREDAVRDAKEWSEADNIPLDESISVPKV